MTTVQQIYEEMQRIAPLALAESWDNPGLRVDCGGEGSAEVGVNEELAGTFVMREMEAFSEGCGRVGSIEPVTVPELAKKAQKELASRCNQPFNDPAVQVKFADTGKTVRRLAVISGAGGSLFEDAIVRGADCLLTGEANHHHAIDA